MAYRGKFKPKNPKKYMGDPTKITYRSLWERKCMLTFDDNPNILKWASEEIAIPYVSPVDRQRHKYFPDFIIELKNRLGKIENVMIEVKPKKQCLPPKPRKRKTQAFLNESKTYAVNQAKWAAAEALCKRKGWEFKVLTEKEIYGK